jgi:phytoene dehydrogenase-like protein
MASYDAIIVGSGPNGLSAAVALAGSGWSVLVREAHGTIGGGTRSSELTLPGFVHDVCSAVHPLAVASPFFRSLPLAQHGLEWVQPSAQLAHPFDDDVPALLERSVEDTSATLGPDKGAYRRLVAPFVERWPALVTEVLAPLHVPRHPLLLARFAVRGVRSARGLALRTFEGARAQALFAGIAAHSSLPLTRTPTAAFGLLLSAAGHTVGWPVARGGSQRIADALASLLESHGGEIQRGAPVESIDELPPARAILMDLTPRQVLRVAGHRLPSRYRHALERFRYGAGAFKIDWALDGPIPWKASECLRAGTVHLGGTLDELTAAESAPWKSEHAERPFVLLGQPSLFDATRAPPGKHSAWAYCHVPHGSTVEMTSRIESQVERFAPGFRDLILARHAMTPAALELHDANLIGGDISGGVMDLGQLFFRPTRRRVPYTTPIDGVYICSASTPPGGAVHGMCGYYAASAAMRDLADGQTLRRDQ